MNHRPLRPKRNALAKLSYTPRTDTRCHRYYRGPIPPMQQAKQGCGQRWLSDDARDEVGGWMSNEKRALGLTRFAGPEIAIRKKGLHKLRGCGKIRILGNYVWGIQDARRHAF